MRKTELNLFGSGDKKEKRKGKKKKKKGWFQSFQRNEYTKGNEMIS